MEKITIEKINNYYKKSYLLITTTFMYIFITLFKNLYFNLYNVNLKNLTNIEQQISTITYQIFAISISLLFLIKQKDKTNDELKKYMKGFLIGISTITIYSLTSFIELIILVLEKVDIRNMSITSKSIYLILCNIMIISITRQLSIIRSFWTRYSQKSMTTRKTWIRWRSG